GYYGNAATSQDMADWAGVSVGTVHNCYKHVMIAILDHHDEFIHFNQEDPADIAEQERAKAYVEAKTCAKWKGGFLCVDGTPFNLFQKPGWHGEDFFDHKSNYSLSNQVVIYPHNLQIVDYIIGVPGSLHDSSAFQWTWVARSPESFFNENEWIWADSAYSSQTWCIVPFKKPTVGTLSRNQKRFNYHLSKVSIGHAGHFYGSLKGCFQSLCELRFQIQNEDDLEYANAWVRSCLILHNMIIKLK
ncbi:hypothetical protein BDN67DRAFT_870215, partial [Paxillus ammoniavirescens]